MNYHMEDATQTAAKIRRALKKKYPEYGAKHFKVRTSKYTGGSSINVKWKDNPSEREVKEIVQQYQSANFDGMQDLEEIHGYVDPEDGEVYVGAKYIFTRRDVSKERDAAVHQYMLDNFEGYTEETKNSNEWMRYKYEALDYFDDNHELKKEHSREYFKEYRQETDEDLDEYIKEVVSNYLLKTPISHLGLTRLAAKEFSDTLGKGSKFREIDDNLLDNFLDRVYSKHVDETGEGIREELQKMKENFLGTLAEYKEQSKGTVEYSANLVLRDFNRDVESDVGSKFNELTKRKYEELKSDFGDVPTLRKFKEEVVDFDFSENTFELSEFVSFRNDNLDEALKDGINKIELKYIKGIEEESLRNDTPEEPEKTDKEKEQEDIKFVAKVIRREAMEQGKSSRDLSKKIDAKFIKGLRELSKEEKEKRIIDKLREGEDVGTKEENKKVEVKQSEVKKTFSSNRDLSEHLIKLLLQGEVNIVFIKANGSERHMRATRNVNLFSEYGNLVEAFNEGNKSGNIGQELNTGTISVVDLDIEGGGARKFVTERLKSFQVGSGEVVEVEIASGESEEEGKHFDPTKELSTKKMIEILGKKVVRLVFEKKDGSMRAMIATRNPNIVRLYTDLDRNGKRPVNNIDKDREADIQTQIDKDYVKVLDVEKKAFRTFKPSKLVKYDADLDIGSWIEFTEKNDAWYNIAFNGVDPREYYQEGKRIGENIGTGLSERISYERQRNEDISNEEAARESFDKSLKQAEERKKKTETKTSRLKQVHQKVLALVKEIPETVKTKEYYKLYEEYLKVPDKLEKDKAFNNMENEITRVQTSNKVDLVVIQIRNEYLYLHPLFILNGYSGRVYADITPNNEFDDIGEEYTSDADTGSEDILEPLAKKVRLLRSGVRNSKKEDSRDGERISRLIELGKIRREEFRQKNVKLFEQEIKSKGISLLGVAVGNKTYLVHPKYFMEVREGKTVVLHSCKLPSPVSEYSKFLNDWVGSADSEAEYKAMKDVALLILRGLDLRKRVA